MTCFIDVTIEEPTLFISWDIYIYKYDTESAEDIKAVPLSIASVILSKF